MLWYQVLGRTLAESAGSPAKYGTQGTRIGHLMSAVKRPTRVRAKSALEHDDQLGRVGSPGRVLCSSRMGQGDASGRDSIGDEIGSEALHPLREKAGAVIVG